MNKSNRGPGGGILGHHFDKRFESVASQALLLDCRILQKTIIYSGFKNPYKVNLVNKKTQVYL
jgi:hypothetical protein